MTNGRPPKLNGNEERFRHKLANVDSGFSHATGEDLVAAVETRVIGHTKTIALQYLGGQSLRNIALGYELSQDVIRGSLVSAVDQIVGTKAERVDETEDLPVAPKPHAVVPIAVTPLSARQPVIEVIQSDSGTLAVDDRSKSACIGVDPEIFFEKVTEEEAVKICKGCVRIDYCLEEALEGDIQDGVWGGLTERERTALRRRARQAFRLGRHS